MRSLSRSEDSNSFHPNFHAEIDNNGLRSYINWTLMVFIARKAKGDGTRNYLELYPGNLKGG
jgi:hypothetical protein